MTIKNFMLKFFFEIYLKKLCEKIFINLSHKIAKLALNKKKLKIV